MKIIQQILLTTALGLCATHAFADGGDSATINFKGSIKVPPCTINTVAPVDMGTNIPISAFHGKGTDDAHQAAFTVSMTCPAGIKALSYQLNPSGGSSIYDANNGVMTLSNADGASGVGVRVLDSDTNASIPLGQNVPINKYQPNQDNQAIDLKFGAIYYQTEDKIKGGEADAQATLTLSYE